MKILTGLLVFVFTAVLAAIGLAFMGGGLHPTLAWTSLGLGAVAGLAAGWTTKTTAAHQPTCWDWMLFVVFAMVSFRAFGWLIYNRLDEICVLSPYNLGDISLHLNFIRYIASGVPFWPESPILSGAPLSYPLGADLFNALGETLGLDTVQGLKLTAFGAAGLTAYALWRWGGAFGLAALLFNGGLAGFVFLRHFEVQDFQQDLVWKNIFLTMFVTQRGLLFALPAGLLLLTAWRDFYFRDVKPWLPFWVQLLLYAAMPIFSIHAFLFLSLLLAGFFVFQKTARLRLLVLVGLALVPATVAVCLVTGFFSPSSGLRYDPTWMMAEEGWKVWYWDFGLSLPLALVALGFAWKTRSHEALVFVGLALAIFALCCVVVFAPWSWDNTKLMIWSWLVIAPYLWTQVVSRLAVAPRVAVCFVLFFSGAISLVGGLDNRHGYPLARRSDLDAWKNVLKDLPPTTRFATLPDYNSPLILLGRKVACGYNGHLMSHGLNYQAKYDALIAALEGRGDWTKTAQLLQVEWLAWRNPDWMEGKKQAPNAPGDIGALYDLRPLLKPNPGSPENPQSPPRSVDLSW